MELDGDVVMMGDPGPEYQSPKRLGHATQYVHVYVDDVDQHFERAKGAGATILSVVEDQTYGDRTYSVEDLEGHRWTFGQHTRDVDPQDW
jgi:uncharacterized glyoxalase superfamily protein PhnB